MMLRLHSIVVLVLVVIISAHVSFAESTCEGVCSQTAATVVLVITASIHSVIVFHYHVYKTKRNWGRYFIKGFLPWLVVLLLVFSKVVLWEEKTCE